MRMQVFVAGLAMAVTAALGGLATAYEGMAVTDGGSLSGTVKYAGAPPAPEKFEVTKDQEVCGKEKTKPDLVVGAGGGIQNAVVVVKATKGKALEPVAKNPVFDQKGCEFHPHVLAFPAGTTLDVLNSDGILHNVHTLSTVNPPTNQAQPKFKKQINVKVEKAEWPIKVQCDAHSWMSAFWIAQEHPYYAVTDVSGTFTIKDIPPGDYEVEVWQEKLGKQTNKVTVKPKEETKVSWEMKKG